MHKHIWVLAGKKSQGSGGHNEVAAIWACSCGAARLVEIQCWQTAGENEEAQDAMSGAESPESAGPDVLEGIMDDLTAEGVQRFLNTAHKN